ncbi:MAG: hypothetical protein RLY16_947 [Bacteroidota bacterium]|jgi:hypothetical protein
MTYIIILTLFISCIFLVINQLIQLNYHILKLRKDKHLLNQMIKEDTNWEFIKGLY